MDSHCWQYGNIMNLNQLKYVISAAMEKNFSRAARAGDAPSLAKWKSVSHSTKNLYLFNGWPAGFATFRRAGFVYPEFCGPKWCLVTKFSCIAVLFRLMSPSCLGGTPSSYHAYRGTLKSSLYETITIFQNQSCVSIRWIPIRISWMLCGT